MSAVPAAASAARASHPDPRDRRDTKHGSVHTALAVKLSTTRAVGGLRCRHPDARLSRRPDRTVDPSSITLVTRRVCSNRTSSLRRCDRCPQ